MPTRIAVIGCINIKIRKATPADAQIIARFNEELAMESEALNLEGATVLAGVKALLADAAKGSYFLAELEGRVVGQLMITYEWSDWRNGNIWWIQSVYVDPSARSRGIFRALYQFVKDLAAREKASCLRLYVHSDNQKAKEAYQRLAMFQTHYLIYEAEL